MATLRIGIVGAGWIGGQHAAALARLGEPVVAVCDLDAERARALAPDAAVFTDHRAMLDAARLEAVWVCTPPLHHGGPALDVLAAGIPLWLEKPVARHLGEAAGIVDAAEASGLPVAVGYQQRALEALERAREELDGQEVGAVLGTMAGPTLARDWFENRIEGGGNILERGSHQVDLARAIAGEVVEVQAVASEVALGQRGRPRREIEDAVTLLLRHESGATTTILVAWTPDGQPRRYRVEVLASDATLAIDLGPPARLTGRSRGRDLDEPATVDPFERGVARFLDAVRAGDQSLPFCRPRDAVETLRVALALERSLLEDGRRVAVDELRPG